MMDTFLVTFISTLLLIVTFQVILWISLHAPRLLFPLIAVETIVTAIGGYLSFLSIGTPLSNAQGTVIRSTVTSGYYSFAFIFGFAALVLSICALLYSKKKWALKYVAAIGLITSAFSLPFLIYYNFFLSRTIQISGISYTIYPNAVQSGIPFALGLYTAFIASIFIAYSRYKGRKAADGMFGVFTNTPSRLKK